MYPFNIEASNQLDIHIYIFTLKLMVIPVFRQVFKCPPQGITCVLRQALTLSHHSVWRPSDRAHLSKSKERWPFLTAHIWCLTRLWSGTRTHFLRLWRAHAMMLRGMVDQAHDSNPSGRPLFTFCGKSPATWPSYECEVWETELVLTMWLTLPWEKRQQTTSWVTNFYVFFTNLQYYKAFKAIISFVNLYLISSSILIWSFISMIWSSWNTQ